MRAALYQGNRHLEVADVPEPTTTEGTVKLAVSRNGICGSDLHEYFDGPLAIPPAGSPHATTGRQIPLVMGHEFAGVITEVGKGVTGLAEDDRVAIEPIYKCNACESCRTGTTTPAPTSPSTAS